MDGLEISVLDLHGFECFVETLELHFDRSQLPRNFGGRAPLRLLNAGPLVVEVVG